MEAGLAVVVLGGSFEVVALVPLLLAGGEGTAARAE